LDPLPVLSIVFYYVKKLNKFKKKPKLFGGGGGFTATADSLGDILPV